MNGPNSVTALKTAVLHLPSLPMLNAIPILLVKDAFYVIMYIQAKYAVCTA